jgi:AbiTii
MLLDEIIEILSDEKGSLNNTLLKTKVLLHSIGRKDLATWVTSELKGYSDENVPEYRVVTAEVHGHVTSYTWQANNYVLPIMHLTKQQRKNLTESRCTMSIGSIEDSIKGHKEKGTKLVRSLPPEFGALFQKVLTPGTHVFSSWCEINMVGVENILSEVRSRLLDFALELRDVVGIDVPEKDLAAKAANVDTERLFTTAVYGTGNTIIIGSQNIQTITNEKDDLEGLLTLVGRLGFQQGELDGLRQAILEDKAQGKTPDVAEGATGKWYTKALKEAGKGVVKTGIDVVSSVLVKAVKAYTTGEP